MLSQEIDDLLCCPRDTITLRDKLRVLTRLNKAEATPEEINIVRNKLSAIRGKKIIFLTINFLNNLNSTLELLNHIELNC